MPPIAAVKYPIVGTVTPNATFTIQNSSGAVIYTGRSVTGTVDISNILQDYLNSELVTVTDENLPDVQNGTLVQQFFLTSSAGVFTVYASNNYNDVWIDEVTDDMLISDIIGKELHPEQIIFADALSPNNTGVINISGTDYAVNGSISVAVGSGSIYEFSPIEQGNTVISANDVAFGNGVFVAVGDNAVYSRSTDGINWNNSRIPAIVNDLIHIEFLNGRFVALSNYSDVAYSTDGNTWNTSRVTNNNIRLNGVAYGLGMWVVSSSDAYMFISATLSTWDSIPLSGFKYGITFANGTFYTFSTSGNYYYSTNIINWTQGNSGSGAVMYDAIYEKNRIVAVGGSGRFSTSLDLQSWNNGNTDLGTINSISFGNNVFVSVSGEDYMVSTDGINWNFGKISPYLFRGVSYGNGYFIGVGASGLAVKFDFIKIADETTISFNGEPIEFNISKGCERYAIYFVNKWGGRTSMLVKGKVVDGVTYGSFKIRTSYNSLSPTAFETRTIRNEVTHTHTFNTGWLTDEDNAKIEDLITSPKVWIHDFEQGIIKSAYVQQTNFTTKRFDNNRVSNSTIVIYEAQDHLRR